jgi:hypothetical protein
MTDRELLKVLLEENKELKSRLKYTSIGLWVVLLAYISIRAETLINKIKNNIY